MPYNLDYLRQASVLRKITYNKDIGKNEKVVKINKVLDNYKHQDNRENMSFIALSNYDSNIDDSLINTIFLYNSYYLEIIGVLQNKLTIDVYNINHNYHFNNYELLIKRILGLDIIIDKLMINGNEFILNELKKSLLSIIEIFDNSKYKKHFNLSKYNFSCIEEEIMYIYSYICVLSYYEYKFYLSLIVKNLKPGVRYELNKIDYELYQDFLEILVMYNYDNKEVVKELSNTLSSVNDDNKQFINTVEFFNPKESFDKTFWNASLLILSFLILNAVLYLFGVYNTVFSRFIIKFIFIIESLPLAMIFTLFIGAIFIGNTFLYLFIIHDEYFTSKHINDYLNHLEQLKSKFM